MFSSLALPPHLHLHFLVAPNTGSTYDKTACSNAWWDLYDGLEITALHRYLPKYEAAWVIFADEF
jgi:hypothetical protein